MRRSVMLGLSSACLVVATGCSTSGSCIEGGEAPHKLPPVAYVSRGYVVTDGGVFDAGGGLTAQVQDAGGGLDRIVYGSREDWAAMDCMTACRGVRDLGLLSATNLAITGCSGPRPNASGELEVVCAFHDRECPGRQ